MNEKTLQPSRHSFALGTASNPAIPGAALGQATWLSRTFAMGVFLLAALVLANWLLGKPVYVARVMSSHVAMDANTAVGLALAALSLWLLAGPAAAAWRQRAALGLALAVAALGAATLAEYLLGHDLGFDRLLGDGPSVEIDTTDPWRMAPETALILAVLGMALYFLARPRLVLAAQALAVLVAMMGLFNLIGYVYGAVAFYKLDHKSSIGIATAVAFVALGAGMLFAQPGDGLMQSITSDLPGGVVIRRLFLAVLFLPLALGWLEMEGERAELFNHTRGTAAAGVAGSLALMMLIWRTAKVLDRSGRGRQQAEEKLHKSNELLKQSVRERTELLASANQSINQGIAERLRMEALLRLQSSALESAANAITIADSKGKVEWVNPSFCALTGYSAVEAIGRDPLELTRSGRHDEAFYKNAWATILAGRVWRSEVVCKRKDGSSYTVFQTITPVREKRGPIGHFICINEDITEKKQFEEQALRAQRVQNLGMLAAGIAHDFNNALAPILMAAPLLRPQVSAAGGQRMLDIIEQCSERGAALVRQMLSFARGTIDQRVPVQVNDVLRDVVEIAKTTFPKSIRIGVQLSNDLWPAMGDPTQINQVFMNLIINARDAMEQGGELVITTANRVLNAKAASEMPDGFPGRFLAVEVRDSGTGIPPEVLARIWEPFFTTKGEGKGTGLGLSTVRGIVRQHNGFVSVKTTTSKQEAHGTTLTVFLPAILAGNAPGGHAAEPGDPARRGEGELILVVDDEESVREVCEKILIRQGYRVVTARDGADAIAVFGTRGEEVQLLITDNDMPIVGGGALITALRRSNAKLPVVIISGDDRPADDERPQYRTTYLAKPFTAGNLMSVVRSVLDEARPAVPCQAEA